MTEPRSHLLPIDRIVPPGDNPRQDFDPQALKALAESVGRVGVLEPIIVRPMGERFELVAGERRLRACQLLSRDTIPATVRELTDREAAEIRLLENLDRRELNPIEEAIGFRRLCELGHSRESLAELIRRPLGSVESRIELLRLPSVWRERVADGTLPPLAAEYLVPFADHPEILAFMDGEFVDQWPIPLASWRARLTAVIVEASRTMDPEAPDGPRFTPTPGELASLDVVEIRLRYGHRESRAMNRALWDRLQRQAPPAPDAAATPQRNRLARSIKPDKSSTIPADVSPPPEAASMSESQARDFARKNGLDVTGAADAAELRAIIRHDLAADSP